MFTNKERKVEIEITLEETQTNEVYYNIEVSLEEYNKLNKLNEGERHETIEELLYSLIDEGHVSEIDSDCIEDVDDKEMIYYKIKDEHIKELEKELEKERRSKKVLSKEVYLKLGLNNKLSYEGSWTIGQMEDYYTYQLKQLDT